MVNEDAPSTDKKNSAIETAEGREVIIAFEPKRCIHARFCVLHEPGVFKANVVGPWIARTDATTSEELVAVAQKRHPAPSRRKRKDSGPEEVAPPVGMGYRVRENGPLALRGDLLIDGASIGTRATFCRCGRSRRRPFCDGAHNAANFIATGELDRRCNAA